LRKFNYNYSKKKKRLGGIYPHIPPKITPLLPADCSWPHRLTYIIMLHTCYVLSQTPESPVWLLSRNRLSEAKKSLAYLRGCVSPDDVEDEFSELSIYAGCNKCVDLEQYADCGMDQRRLSYVKYLQIKTNDATNGNSCSSKKYIREASDSFKRLTRG
jgi:hypothetical protein